MNKKELEQSYLDKFIEVSGIVLDGKVRRHERPDFLVEGESSVLGIELTRLFQKAAEGNLLLREQESLWERILMRAKEIYDQLGNPPIHVNVSFNHSKGVKKSDVERLAKKIAGLGQMLIPNLNEFADEEYDWENRAYFPEEVNRIYLGRFPSLTRSFWGQSGGLMISELSPASIQNEIRIKDQRVDAYLESCAQVWLILCCYGEGLASWFDISEQALTSSYRTKFSRVFWFSFQGKVHELRIEP